MIVKNLVQDAAIKISNTLGITLPQAISEARVLMRYLSGWSLEYLIAHQDETLDKSSIKQFEDLVSRRSLSEPIAYIIGAKEFYGREFLVDRNTLIPRSDSETIIDAVLKAFPKDSKLKILELGVGSGCLIITLLLELKNSTGYGVDISDKALKIAEKNAKNLAVEKKCVFIQSDWFNNVEGCYDIIICNPPYILDNEKHLMSKETIDYEPHAALFGDFSIYKNIINSAKRFLNKDGKIYMEIGCGHEKSISDMFLSEGYLDVQEYKDLEERARVISAIISPNKSNS
ncbi:MAG: hypothetical protein RLZZ59_266 [Pseudomonadota bacterium]|jgi:release factor glutamine methyltransferase